LPFRSKVFKLFLPNNFHPFFLASNYNYRWNFNYIEFGSNFRVRWNEKKRRFFFRFLLKITNCVNNYSNYYLVQLTFAIIHSQMRFSNCDFVDGRRKFYVQQSDLSRTLMKENLCFFFVFFGSFCRVSTFQLVLTVFYLK
jgi:hypothetical protein